MSSPVAIGQKFFKYRDYTPLPLLLLIFILAHPSVFSATIGTLLVALGEAVRVYSVSFIGTVSRTRNDHGGSQLIKEGPYGLVRNPLYVGNFFISAGIALYSGSLIMLLLTILLFMVQYYYIVKYEESLLANIYGEEYLLYCQSVPAWIPNRNPSVATAPQGFAPPDSLAMAFKSERKTLLAIAAVMIVLVLR